MAVLVMSGPEHECPNAASQQATSITSVRDETPELRRQRASMHTHASVYKCVPLIPFHISTHIQRELGQGAIQWCWTGCSTPSMALVRLAAAMEAIATCGMRRGSELALRLLFLLLDDLVHCPSSHILLTLDWLQPPTKLISTATLVVFIVSARLIATSV